MLTVTTTDVDGVYRSGFATTQKAYEDAVIPLFESLDRLEKMLTGKDYLIGDQLTEADVRLFVTIVSGLCPWCLRLCSDQISADPFRRGVSRRLQVQPQDHP